MLYCIVFFILQHNRTQHNTSQSHITSYIIYTIYRVSYHIISYHIISYIILYYIILYYIILYYIILYYIILYYYIKQSSYPPSKKTLCVHSIRQINVFMEILSVYLVNKPKSHLTLLYTVLWLSLCSKRILLLRNYKRKFCLHERSTNNKSHRNPEAYNPG